MIHKTTINLHFRGSVIVLKREHLTQKKKIKLKEELPETRATEK